MTDADNFRIKQSILDYVLLFVDGDERVNCGKERDWLTIRFFSRVHIVRLIDICNGIIRREQER